MKRSSGRKRIFNSTESVKIVFRMFTRKEAVFGKTNYSPICLLLGHTYKQNMSEIDFFDLSHQKLISVDICAKPLLSRFLVTTFLLKC